MVADYAILATAAFTRNFGSMNPPPNRTALVLRIAATIDLLIAALLAFTPYLAARVGRPVAMAIAGVIAAGAVILFVLSGRLGRAGNVE